MSVDNFYITSWELVERLLIAALLGSIIGWEREQRNKQAGLKTHLLVSLGSALIMLISIYGFNDWINHPNARFDPARLAAQVVSGIGFLGAGAILRQSNLVISGLTTAATLWVVAAIGLSVGAGFYTPAVATVAIVLVIMFFMRKLEARIVRTNRFKSLKLIMIDRPGMLGKITSVLGEEDIDIRRVHMVEENMDEEEGMIEIRLEVRMSPRKNLLHVVHRLHEIGGVKEVQYDE